MGRYNAKIENRDRVEIFHGETASLEFRIYDPDTVYPFQLIGFTPKVFFPKADGTWLEKTGEPTNNHLGQFRVVMTESEVYQVKLSEVPVKAKDPAPVPLEVLLESATVKVIIQLKNHLVVNARLAAPAPQN